jgi:hypothetical protein
LSAETGYNIRFYTNGSSTERFIINTSGNVGIGITNPSQKLHVSGRLQVDPIVGLNLTSTATTTLVTLPSRCPVLVSVHMNWNSNGNGVRQVLLYCGVVNLGWGSPASAITILASQDMSFGYVGTPTFTIGGSGDNRTLEISVANASATGTVDVAVRATVLHLGVEN